MSETTSNLQSFSLNNVSKEQLDNNLEDQPNPKRRKVEIAQDLEQQTSQQQISEDASHEQLSNTVTGTKCSVTTSATDVTPATLSKNQLKKLQKKEKWLANKQAKRAAEKQKLKQRKIIAQLNNVKLGPSRKELKNSTMASSKCRVRIVIDMSFDDLMNEKDISKCIKQLHWCYSLNRRAQNPLQLYVTSFGGKSKTIMEKHSGYTNWDINFRSESYDDIFKKEELLYLTSESSNILTTLDDQKVYIIGGLVDHNSQKGLCHKLAEERGLAHAQLPIGEFIHMKTRKVLAINHVFEILLGVSSGLSWKEALLKVMPSRKGVTEKVDTQLESENKICGADSGTKTDLPLSV